MYVGLWVCLVLGPKSREQEESMSPFLAWDLASDPAALTPPNLRGDLDFSLLLLGREAVNREGSAEEKEPMDGRTWLRGGPESPL